MVQNPLAFKLYLKLDGAHPTSKNLSCCHPIVTAARQTPADIVIFLEKQTLPGGSLLFVTEA